jgi:hypothetical protein
VTALFEGFAAPWWVSGGYALELAAGHSYREHGDVDIGVLRRDHLAVRAFLAGWDCHAADPPGTLRPWPLGEVLPPHVHDIWVREPGGSAWRFQLMLDESEGGTWIYRRDARIRRPLDELFAGTPPRIAPEVQLLYKSRGLRPKDERDFDVVLPLLSSTQRAWLGAALAREHGAHPWLARLT